MIFIFFLIYFVHGYIKNDMDVFLLFEIDFIVFWSASSASIIELLRSLCTLHVIICQQYSVVGLLEEVQWHERKAK